jgi:hypothetical protein
MKNWKRFIPTVATMLLAVSPIVAFNSCGFWFVGEPQLPKNILMQKEGKEF